MRLLFIVALGCGAPKDTNPPVPVDTDTDTDADSDTDTDTDSDTDTDTAPPVLPDPVVVTVTTRDSVDLVADYYAASGPGRPGVVLSHMIPPSNDRSSWPVDFVTRLQAHDWGVVVVDRRGAGDSGGVAVDAYTGEWGRYDVEACVLQLVADGATEIVLIGASNGTTSALDYAAWAAGEGLPVPAALGFMTGGTYTETNTPMSALPSMPAVFTYSTAEAAWSVAQAPLDPGSWSMLEYADGAHGTDMFGAAPEVSDDLDAFLVSVL
jgi:pimeloyl-ACP methyl ester carboxylesterase